MRRLLFRKRFPSQNSFINNYIVTLLVNNLSKNGNRCKAEFILYRIMKRIYKKFRINPIIFIAESLKNLAPKHLVLKVKINGKVSLKPVEIEKYKSICIGIKWLIQYCNKRRKTPQNKKIRKNITKRLKTELIRAFNDKGRVIRRKNRMKSLALTLLKNMRKKPYPPEEFKYFKVKPENHFLYNTTWNIPDL